MGHKLESDIWEEVGKDRFSPPARPAKIDLGFIYNPMKFSDWAQKRSRLDEVVSNSKYSVEVNYRTKPGEVLEGFAKIALGYVSASLKRNGYHVKQVFDERPIRIVVSSRNWDDGEWVGMISYKPQDQGGCFLMSNGFYNRDRKTVSVQRTEKCSKDTPAEMAKDIINMMYGMRNKKDRKVEKLNPVHLKRGPKR